MNIVNKNFKSKILRDSSYPLYYSIDSSIKGVELVKSPLSKKKKDQNILESKNNPSEDKNNNFNESTDTNNQFDDIKDTLQSKS